MEIKIGIQHANRELTVDVEQTVAEVTEAVRKALAEDGVVSFVDKRGRTVIIPANRITYLELGQEHARPVGFGAV